MSTLAEQVNVLARFCGPRDVGTLDGVRADVVQPAPPVTGRSVGSQICT